MVRQGMLVWYDTETCHSEAVVPFVVPPPPVAEGNMAVHNRTAHAAAGTSAASHRRTAAG